MGEQNVGDRANTNHRRLLLVFAVIIGEALCVHSGCDPTKNRAAVAADEPRAVEGPKKRLLFKSPIQEERARAERDRSEDLILKVAIADFWPNTKTTRPGRTSNSRARPSRPWESSPM